MIRCYYLGGQRIDPVLPVVRWLIDVWTAFLFCAGKHHHHRQVWENATTPAAQSHGRAGLEPRPGNPRVDDVLANGQSSAGIAKFLQDQTVGKPR
jgi:hypothetical protein